MLVDLKAKYMNLPSSPAWNSVTGSRFISSHMADFDNDGRDEVVALSAGPLGNSVGVLAYFAADGIAPTWSTMSPPCQMLTAAFATGPQIDWTPPESGFVLFGKVRNREGVDLVLFDSTALTLTLVRWEQTDLGEGAHAFILNSNWSASGSIAGATGQSAWTLSATDLAYVGDVDGDGVAELLLFDGSANLGLAKWTGQALEMVWSSSGGVVAGEGSQPTWNLAAGQSFYLGDINADGIAEIIAFDGIGTLALMRWTASSIELYWVTSGEVYSITDAPNWPLSAPDWFHIADINGDGQNEVIAFDGTNLGAFRWNGSDLRVLGVNQGSVTGSAGDWSLAATQLNYVGNIEASAAAGIAAVNGGQIAILRWDEESALFAADFINSTLTGDGGLAWAIGADNQFTCADVDGDGFSEIVVQSDGTQSFGLLKWVDGALVPLWVGSDASGSNASPMQSWGVGLVAQAPASPFVPFEGPQFKIYQLASETLCGSDINDIRQEYANTNENTQFGSWRTGLLDADSSESAWSWMNGFEEADLNAVFTQLEVELNGVATSYQLNANTNQILNGVWQQRKQDLNTVVSNLTIPPQPTSPVGYWVGQIFDAALWGVAAISVEGFPIVSIVDAMIASMFGSLLGSVNNDNPEQTINYDALAGQIDQEYHVASDANNTQQAAFVLDPVKLEMLGQLLSTVWQMTSTTAQNVAAASSPYTRLNLYQNLVPQLFALWEWGDMVGTNGQYNAGQGWVDIYPPGNATWTFIEAMQYTRIYIMATSSSWPGSFEYPSSALTDDLFGNQDGQLNLSLSDFLGGGGPLGVSVNQADGTDPVTPPFYITNSSGSEIWVTIYIEPFDTHLHSGWMGTGTTVWTGLTAWGSYYKVRSQVNGNNPDTSIHIHPENIGSAKGYAVNLVDGGDYWEHVN